MRCVGENKKEYENVGSTGVQQSCKGGAKGIQQGVKRVFGRFREFF